MHIGFVFGIFSFFSKRKERNRYRNLWSGRFFSPTTQDMIIAGKVDGGYYFTDNIGITEIIMYGQTTGLGWDLSLFNIYTGISIRL